MPFTFQVWYDEGARTDSDKGDMIEEQVGTSTKKASNHPVRYGKLEVEVTKVKEGVTVFIKGGTDKHTIQTVETDKGTEISYLNVRGSRKTKTTVTGPESLDWVCLVDNTLSEYLQRPEINKDLKHVVENFKIQLASQVRQWRADRSNARAKELFEGKRTGLKFEDLP
ncbi:MAG: hypothetical protein A2527_04840 [Candidatus Lambdaproteobacteria bacterium RIFOXYD2_FULL_50_16]|uniref:Uncharacterized protein n=1 Tax=Candidatus Lambdaproteobacteria bacterium RIFOXYD2_FULL_50_16 TaxID=1817772 RepID=A0A1F6GBE4_9PROT|nr:MAG: hypothetical protein A2527_04840 [Candidatus Lambdaproteobacteria bacterium RIFOXYD2_FULL_50_16]